ncbi:unnamed protein product [Clonostachys rosea f. rosea IK726]|uniref:Uncharacterized protein n=1 Tax=Clonostachys rosea f. rosea IK726 TaxID=1349383 RepID=A0ACA9UCW7_BIOOC|nr:unnamed protein product [Clonostachys rosea f. rosea IK726]
MSLRGMETVYLISINTVLTAKSVDPHVPLADYLWFGPAGMLPVTPSGLLISIETAQQSSWPVSMALALGVQTSSSRVAAAMRAGIPSWRLLGRVSS